MVNIYQIPRSGSPLFNMPWTLLALPSGPAMWGVACGLKFRSKIPGALQPQPGLPCLAFALALLTAAVAP